MDRFTKYSITADRTLSQTPPKLGGSVSVMTTGTIGGTSKPPRSLPQRLMTLVDWHKLACGPDGGRAANNGFCSISQHTLYRTTRKIKEKEETKNAQILPPHPTPTELKVSVSSASNYPRDESQLI